MIAAIYCRKSTEQTGVADDQKSVARQIEHAKAYAVRKGWTVADEHVYVDDNASGAEFSTRPFDGGGESVISTAVANLRRLRKDDFAKRHEYSRGSS